MASQSATPVPTEEGVLSLERVSVKPFRTQDEYLYAMREDLAEWFNTLYGTSITAEDFFSELDTGVLLCQHANAVQSFIAENSDLVGTSRVPDKGVSYKSSVKAGKFNCGSITDMSIIISYVVNYIMTIMKLLH